MKRYFVVRGGDTGADDTNTLFNQFLQRVEELLEEGWTCQGGVAITFINHGMILLAQAMVKEE